jgi:hypothetical protein
MSQEAVHAQESVERKSSRPIPSWVAGTAAVVFLLVAGGFIYWFLGGSFAGTSDLIPDAARAERTQGRGGWRQANADGVQSLPDKRGYLVRSGSAFMDVETDKKPPNYRFRYDSQALLTPEQWHMALGLRRISQDAQMAKVLAVTQDQLDRLRRYGAIPMEVGKPDRDRVIAAWEEYQKATAKGEPEKKLVAALKDAGAKGLAATKVRAEQRVGEISKVLTPEQVRELTKLGAGEKVTPITR